MAEQCLRKKLTTQVKERARGREKVGLRGSALIGISQPLL